MLPRRLKDYMPRSLYGRAALIILVPIVTTLTVVSVVFVQRLYDEVTRQMTETVATDLGYVLERIAEDPGAADAIVVEIARPLGFEIAFGASPVTDDRAVFDLTGGIVIETLRETIGQAGSVDLVSDPGRVRMTIDTAAGTAEVAFSRRRVSARNPHQLLVIMGLTAILMTVVSFLYLRGQVRPITRLAAAAEAFGKGRVVPYRPTGATEVRAAGGAFLDMRNRIERQIEQRTLMLSGVSHDLRTPLTRMKLALSMMEPDEETRALQQDVNEMERMLDSFLNFARSDALDDPEAVDPLEIARDAVDRALRGGAAVELGEIRGRGPVHLRPVAVARAIDNLVGNAARHASRARVGVVVTDRAVRFIVEDDGPGIPEDMHGAALKPFQRLDAARNQDAGSGVGLGMAIAADIARQHGGQLRLGRSDMGGLKAELVLARSTNFDLGGQDDR